jgi:hypothetical protein
MLKRYGWEPVLALGFISLGFILIGVGWNGAASKDCVECQLPYLLSGGIAGLGLIVLGASLLLFVAGRRMLDRLDGKFDSLIEAAQGMAAGEHAATNGKAPVPQAVPDGMVVVGRSSFHLPDCRLVQGKETMDTATIEDAQARGLNACRVCEPTAVRSSKRR